MAEITHYYTENAGIYDKAMDKGFISRLIRRDFQICLMKQFSNADYILDIGCGTGTDAIFLAQTGARVHGIDISSGMIEVARKKALETGLQNTAHFSLMDANTIAKLPDNAYDGAYANFNTLNHLVRLEKFAEELSQKIKSDSTVVFTMMNRVCLIEVLGYALRFQFKTAFRKLFFREKTLAMHTKLYFPETVKKIFEPYFSCTSTQGFGLFVPVSQHYQGRILGFFFKIMAAIEQPLLRLFPFFNVCDHYILTLKKK